MTTLRGEAGVSLTSGQRPLHLLLDILRLKVPLDVNNRDVDHTQHQHSAPEAGAAPNNGLELDVMKTRLSIF